MPAGGPRVGAGRPRKGEAPAVKPEDEASVEAEKLDLTPLEYMLQVMNDRTVEKARRDRMAVAAAPYVHGKAPDAATGKKDQRRKAAEDTASGGSKFAPPRPPKLVVDNR